MSRTHRKRGAWDKAADVEFEFRWPWTGEARAEDTPEARRRAEAMFHRDRRQGARNAPAGFRRERNARARARDRAVLAHVAQGREAEFDRRRRDANWIWF